MKRNAVSVILCILALVSVTAVAQSTLAEERVSIVGTVSHDGYITTDDGDLFLIGANANGFAVASLAGKRLEVSGVIFEVEDDLYILIEEYSVVEGSK